jgi:hypothetical protein
VLMTHLCHKPVGGGDRFRSATARLTQPGHLAAEPSPSPPPLLEGQDRPLGACYSPSVGAASHGQQDLRQASHPPSELPRRPACRAKRAEGPMLGHNCPAPLRRRLTANTFCAYHAHPAKLLFFCGNLHAPSLVLIRKDEYSRRKDEYFRPISYVGRTEHHRRIILGALNAFGSDGASAQFGHLPRLAGRVVEFGVAANPHAPKPVMHIQQKTLRSREAPQRAARPWR